MQQPVRSQEPKAAATRRLRGKSFGASVAVVVDDDRTESFIGARSVVTALGKPALAPLKIKNGKVQTPAVFKNRRRPRFVAYRNFIRRHINVGIGAAGATGNQGATVGIGGSVTVNIVSGNTIAHVGRGANRQRGQHWRRCGPGHADACFGQNTSSFRCRWRCN